MQRTQRNCRTISSKRFYIGVICAYLGVCIWLVYALIDGGRTHLVVCPTKLLWHIPCPGCGVTRATVLFLHGHILEALALNPNVLFAIAFLILTLPMLLYDAIAQKHLTMRAYEACERALKNKWVLLLFCLFEAAIWIHNIVCHV